MLDHWLQITWLWDAFAWFSLWLFFFRFVELPTICQLESFLAIIFWNICSIILSLPCFWDSNYTYTRRLSLGCPPVKSCSIHFCPIFGFFLCLMFLFNSLQVCWPLLLLCLIYSNPILCIFHFSHHHIFFSKRQIFFIPSMSVHMLIFCLLCRTYRTSL